MVLLKLLCWLLEKSACGTLIQEAGVSFSIGTAWMTQSESYGLTLTRD